MQSAVVCCDTKAISGVAHLEPVMDSLEISHIVDEGRDSLNLNGQPCLRQRFEQVEMKTDGSKKQSVARYI